MCPRPAIRIIPSIRGITDNPGIGIGGRRRQPPARPWFQASVAAALAFGAAAASRPPPSWDAWRLDHPEAVPTAYQRDGRVRLYFGEPPAEVMLEGRLQTTRDGFPAADFGLIRLQYDRSPPRRPDGSRRWRRVPVVAGETWTRLIAALDAALVPAGTNRALCFQTALGEGLVWRNPRGDIQRRWGRQPPPGVRIVRQMSLPEFGRRLAGEIRRWLEVHWPGEPTVCLVANGGSAEPFFLFVDQEQRRVLACLPPREDDPRVGHFLPATLTRDVATLVVEGHLWAFVKNPVSSAARLVDRAGETVRRLLASRLKDVAGEPPPLAPDRPGMDLESWESWLDRKTGTRREPGSVRFLVDGVRFFPVLEKRLQEARKSIRLQVGIYDNDDVAVAIADLLRDKSRTVTVQVLMDRYSSTAAHRAWSATPPPPGFRPPRSIAAYLERGSRVHVRPFLNTWGSADHTKLYLIDGRFAYVGGMNVGREYRFEWHDLMSEVRGPIVASLEREFALAWAHAGALGDLAALWRRLNSAAPPSAPEPDADQVLLRRLHTTTTSKTIHRAVREAIDRARREVFLENPYLFSNDIIVALARARHRGVDVRVVMGAKNNMAGGPASNLVVANYLLGEGVRVYFYPGMSHVKALLVDGWACWGSANFNGLSLRNNLELNLASSDPRVAGALRRDLFEPDFALAHELTRPVQVSWTDALMQNILSRL
ncbi:MAG: phosphatidylserine/phosphatidylglycerophosphate/cardiolipin synthase family protein [Verrucomicrobia bacterium]|nr:MAG: phosphatidylserine/phosphatidylglycerophosphate/cardiolipin synthase family protein [Verrucomicrobiota bacterium]